MLTQPSISSSFTASSSHQVSRQSSLDMFSTIYHTASDFLRATEPYLQLREREANCILPLAQKYRDYEQRYPAAAQLAAASKSLSGAQREHYEDIARCKAQQQLWIAVWSYSTASSQPALDVVLSCTASHLATLPVFLYSTHETSSLTREYLEPRMQLLARRLLEVVSRERVFSVFAPNLLTQSFASVWSAKTGMCINERPYYSAALTYVTSETLAFEDYTRAPSLPRSRYLLRVATRSDLLQIAEHCFQFASDSDFPIDKAGAEREALHYINAKQMWVCAVEMASGEIEIGSIVAVTRNTLKSATITKVHTAPNHRKRGYAELLVRHVCESLLLDDNVYRKHAPEYTAPYESISLYVAHDNIAAATVYDRVGFAGLLGKPRPSGVGDVLELGFIGATKGYW